MCHNLVWYNKIEKRKVKQLLSINIELIDMEK